MKKLKTAARNTAMCSRGNRDYEALLLMNDMNASSSGP